MHRTRTIFSPLIIVLAGCVAAPVAPPPPTVMTTSAVRVTEHRQDDDLLTAGLGLAGLRLPLPPPFADPGQPTAGESRRRAIWSNWRGIADLMPGGGYGEFYGSAEPVPGREFSALLRLPEAKQPFRALLQLPDAFDADRPCLIVAAASGSRGIYGAISLASAWGLPRGCAVVHTDKGAGSGWFDHRSARGVKLDGTPGGRDEELEFAPDPRADGRPLVAIKHLHSGDNPEADWGRHVEEAARFGLDMLSQAHPGRSAFTPGNTRIIAVGLSNGGGAVLRAAERARGWLDGVVAISANTAPGRGGRPLFDYASEAALFMPCALLDSRFDSEPNAWPGGVAPAGWVQRCASLHAAGLLKSGSLAGQSAEALAMLIRSGWQPPALAAAGASTGLDIWRAVAAGYSAAYLRLDAGRMACGYGYAVLDEDGLPRPATAAEHAGWWSENSGIPPAGTVTLLDAFASGVDPPLMGLICLRNLWSGEGELPDRLRESVAATRAGLPPDDLPMVLVHGIDDGLIPEAFSTGAYVDWLRANGRNPTYWRVGPAQHFDAFLAFPAFAARYLPLMPYAYRALDALWANLDSGAPLPASRDLIGRSRAIGESGLEPLTPDHLGMD